MRAFSDRGGTTCCRILARAQTGFDGSQVLPVTRDGDAGRGQQRSQACLSQQVTLDLQNQTFEFGPIWSEHGPKVLMLDSVRCSELHTITRFPAEFELIAATGCSALFRT